MNPTENLMPELDDAPPPAWVTEAWDPRQLALLEAMGLSAYVLNLPDAADAPEAAAQAGIAAPAAAPHAAANGPDDDRPWQADEAADVAGADDQGFLPQGSAMPARPSPVRPASTAPSATPPATPSASPGAAPSAPVRPMPASDSAAPAAMPAPLKPVAVRHVAELPAHVAALDWGGLKAAVAGCEACELCGTRQQTVFGVGHPQAQWMIVGEAPGEQEDQQGEPFVGRSGQLLDAMLAAMGLSRAEGPASRQVFIANVIKCRPPANRNPSPEEVARCEPYLRKQVALVKPRMLLALGRFAAQSLLQTTEPIGRLRGKVHHYQGIPVVVSYHPSYLLRSPQEKAKAWQDLCLAMKVMAAAQPGA